MLTTGTIFYNAKDSGRTNNYTSFTNSQNSFELGMASLKADYAIGKVDGVIDLGFGRRAEEFSYNDQGAMAAIKQAYVSFAASDKVKFTMGKWGTHVGYELLDAYLNRNYSMDYGLRVHSSRECRCRAGRHRATHRSPGARC